jgi:hypothetical protein
MIIKIIILLSNIYLCSGILHDLSIEFNRYVNNNINITDKPNYGLYNYREINETINQPINETIKIIFNPENRMIYI